jgi:ABC-2 type transport system ATP-binding protein
LPQGIPRVLVETQSLTKRYGSLTALADCGLQIKRGEIFGLLGPNGSGKTTLLRLLMGFLRPTQGTAHIDGLDCYRQSVAVHTRVSYLPADARLFRRMRGSDVLRFFSRARAGSGWRAALDRANRVAGRLQLNLARAVSAMSTGMRQKLALTVTLSADVPLLILDEPTENLDPNVRSDVIALVREARERGQTVLFSSHVLDEVEKVCDRAAILRQGSLVHMQEMSTLRRQHRIRATATAPLPPIPQHLADQLSIESNNGELVILTPGELSPWLGWLATLPLAEVQIEPVGLRAVYDRFHSASGTQKSEVGNQKSEVRGERV